MRFIGLLVIILTLFSCELGLPTAEREKRAQKATGNIIIGAVGHWSSDNDFSKQGIEMAREEINSAGGVLGRKLQIDFHDDEGSITKGKIIAQELAQNVDMVAVIGHYHSRLSLAVSAIYQYHGMLMLSSMSTSPEVTRQGFDFIFRSIPGDEYFAQKLVSYVELEGYDKMVIYSSRGNYGMRLANAFENQAVNKGIKIVDHRTYDLTVSSLSFITDLREWTRFYDFDAIFIAGRIPHGAEFIRWVRQEGIQVPIIGGNRLKSPRLLDIAGSAAEGVVVASSFDPSDPDPVSKQFSLDFEREYGMEPNTGAAQGYDAVNLIVHAMERAGATKPREIADALSETRNWRGVTGLHSFNARGEVVGKKVDLSIVRDGAFKILDHSDTGAAADVRD
jgi:branched-chain amino acid transport system substrate-binding protein